MLVGGLAGAVQTQQPDGSWVVTGVDCNPADPEHQLPVVTPAIAREQVVKMLPPIPIGIAPDTGPTLVNIQTIFWSPTATDRDLGPVTILGLPVAIHIHFDHITYRYGDGTTGTDTTPGKAWTDNACTTAQCPDFHGHTYTAKATNLTAQATIAWTATFAVAGGPAQVIPGTINGPTTTHPVTVIEARAILVR